ncbi:radial spoke head protein 9 homolog [Cylas formicarius]|uniref:radial spoke head protein 9 homolog n=1 Tax=Cylas formicarius TaxID=197179 RepID=UPI00295881AD|nr:radial spoke head protein 9 homolog [Cylas formicarius]
MNIDSVLDSLQLIGTFGHIISTAESLILHNSLLILQTENHFQNVFYWGKILGTEDDYYIAYGYSKDILLKRTYYYSKDCINWGLLPQPNNIGLELTPLCKTNFQGNAALVTEIKMEEEQIMDARSNKPPLIKRLKEEDRLSATVHLITKEAAVVPRGALFKRSDGVIVENRSFEGLSPLEATDLASYQHFRPATQKLKNNLFARKDYNYAIDFLDTIDMDVPTNCWTIQPTIDETGVIIRSMYWPGMIFYHFSKTPKHGFLYTGNGKKCIDLPFM